MEARVPVVETVVVLMSAWRHGAEAWERAAVEHRHGTAAWHGGWCG